MPAGFCSFLLAASFLLVRITTITALSGTADWRMTVEAYRIDECGRMIAESEPDEDSWTPWNSAQSELAALREELAEARVTVQDLHEAGEFLDKVSQGVEDGLRKSLAAAEQRNVLMSQFLKRMLDGHGMDRLAAWQSEIDMVLTDAALKPTESGASE